MTDVSIAAAVVDSNDTNVLPQLTVEARLNNNSLEVGSRAQSNVILALKRSIVASMPSIGLEDIRITGVQAKAAEGTSSASLL